MHSFTAVMEKNSKSQRQIQNEDLDFDKLCGRCSAINARYKTALLIRMCIRLCILLEWLILLVVAMQAAV